MIVTPTWMFHKDLKSEGKETHILTFTFHYQLMHLLIKTLSQFTFKTTHVKNVCDAYLKLILKKPNMFRSVLRPSSGVRSRTLRDYYVSACLLRRISVKCDEAGRLIPSNCARYGNGPLMMVGGLTETCWVFLKLILSTHHRHF